LFKWIFNDSILFTTLTNNQISQMKSNHLSHGEVASYMSNSITRVFLIFALFAFSFSGFAQNRIYQKIEQAKNSRIAFPEKDVFKESQVRYSNTDIFFNPGEVKMLNYNLKLSELEDGAISIKVPLGNETVTVDLLEVDQRFYEFELTVNQKEPYKGKRTKAKHYRGVVRGKPNSLAALSFFENDAAGFISTENGNYNIAKLNNADSFILYNDTNLKGAPELNCDMPDEEFTPYDKDVLKRTDNFSQRSFDTNCVGFYFETEVDMFNTLGSVAAVQNYVTALYNQVAIIYQNEGIDTNISAMNIWTVTDPYTSFSASGTLTQFQNNTGAFTGDLGHLLTFRNVGGGIAAGFDGICNPNSDLSLCISGNLASTVTNFPTYSWNVMVVSHEFGHLFGSRHTHACIWNGNNTAIDGCGSCQENANPNISGCNWCTRPPIPTNGGTIMSYCHITSAGINFSLGFGPQPGNVIRDNVANGACLGSCDPCPAGVAFDIYSKDRPFDTGVEPNPDSGPMWISEDIWIRQSLDGGTTHQNPEFKLSEPNGVYVKIRNRGNNTSGCARLKVYFSKASTGLQWPTHFNNFYQNVGGNSVLHGDILGIADIPPIAPGNSVTIELPWYPPNPADFTTDIHHFCLVSRIVSVNDPMFNEVSGSVSPNVRNNNNIAWKNVSVYNVDPNDLPAGTSVFVRGINRNAGTNTIMFVDDGFEDPIKVRLFDVAEVELEVEPKLFERILETGFRDQEGMQVIKENTFLITRNKMELPKIPIEYGETFAMNFKFHLFKEIPEGTELLFDVLQMNDEKGIPEGGERFLVVNGKRKDYQKTNTEPSSFKIIPNPNDGIFKLELDNLENGSYQVYDVYGNLILTGAFTNEKTIDINLSKGKKQLYVVKLNSGGLQLSKILIKK
jgi:hypothetical protein